MNVKIAPSILSANFAAMGEDVQKLERCGADMIHCDVMDGSFVGPITFGGQMIKAIRPLTRLPLDVHLMIEHPQTQIKFIAEAGADIITVHYGAGKKISPHYLEDTLKMIKSYGLKCGVVINPDVPDETIFPFIHEIDMLLLMSVFPGYGGQKFIPEVMDKLTQARAYADSIGRTDLDIEVDGGVTLSNAKSIVQAGANVLVAGSAVFKAPDMAAAIAALKAV